MDNSSRNFSVYSDFINHLMENGKTDRSDHSSFMADIEIIPQGRSCKNCIIRFFFNHATSGGEISINPSNMLNPNEKYKQGIFPSGFFTKRNPNYPGSEFSIVEGKLVIKGVYFGKNFTVIISPK